MNTLDPSLSAAEQARLYRACARAFATAAKAERKAEAAKRRATAALNRAQDAVSLITQTDTVTYPGYDY